MPAESVLIFTIEGKFAFFRAKEVTRATLSFPFTRVAIVGLIGAILGYERNSYWENNHPLGNSSIAIEIQNTIQHLGFTVNYTHTKTPIKLSKGKIDTFLPSGPKSGFRGFVTDVRLDMIYNLKMQIYFKSENEELYQTLKKSLEKRHFVYPPYLGHANLLADITYKGEYKIKEIKDSIIDINTVIGISCLSDEFANISNPKLTIIPNIPIASVISNEKMVNSISESFVISTDPAAPIKVKLKSSEKSYSVKLSDDETKNIVFCPIYVADSLKNTDIGGGQNIQFNFGVGSNE